MEKELQSSLRKNKVVSSIKGTSASLDVIEAKDGSKIAVKRFNKNVGIGEGKKNILINEQLEDVEGVKAPEIFDYYEKKVVMEYMNSISFEKYYMKYFKNERRIKAKLKYIAKALSSIHSINWNSKEKEVFVHGDFHLENILIEKEGGGVVIIDPSVSINKDEKYRDLAMFMYHLNFKIPYKYFSLKVYIKSFSHIEYFLKEYCRYYGEEINLKDLNRYRVKIKNQNIKIIKNCKINIFLKFILIMHLKWRIFLIKRSK